MSKPIHSVYFVFIAISLSACAPEKDKPAPVPPPAPLISEIPKNCVMVEAPSFGAHEFGPGQVHTTISLDCGIREGKRCWYYVQANALTGVAPLEDVRCE